MTTEMWDGGVAIYFDDTDRVLLRFADARGDKGFVEQGAAVVINWAQDAQLQKALLELVLDGRVIIGVRDGELVFSAVEGV